MPSIYNRYGMLERDISDLADRVAKEIASSMEIEDGFRDLTPPEWAYKSMGLISYLAGGSVEDQQIAELVAFRIGNNEAEIYGIIQKYECSAQDLMREISEHVSTLCAIRRLGVSMKMAKAERDTNRVLWLKERRPKGD